MPNGTWQFHFFPAFFWWVGHMRRCCKTPIGCQNAEYQEILGNAEFIEQKKYSVPIKELWKSAIKFHLVM